MSARLPVIGVPSSCHACTDVAKEFAQLRRGGNAGHALRRHPSLMPLTGCEGTSLATMFDGMIRFGCYGKISRLTATRAERILRDMARA